MYDLALFDITCLVHQSFEFPADQCTIDFFVRPLCVGLCFWSTTNSSCFWLYQMAGKMMYLRVAFLPPSLQTPILSSPRDFPYPLKAQTCMNSFDKWIPVTRRALTRLCYSRCPYVLISVTYELSHFDALFFPSRHSTALPFRFLFTCL